MKVLKAGLSLLAIWAAGAAPAIAADWGSGESYKDMGVPAAIPVPAPIPVPEYRPSWYFRFDAALGVISDPDISGDIDGLVGVPGSTAGPGSLALPNWFETDFDTFLTVGAGVGYRFGGGWRMDATIEKRSKDDVTGNGTTAESEVYGFDIPGTGDYIPIDADNNGTADSQRRYVVSDQAKVDGTLWMLNLYYDLTQRGPFTPYVGAGVGFAWNEISRTQTIASESCDNQAPIGGCADGTFTAPVTIASASNKSDTVSFAAALMAGLSYDVTDITTIDVGYRYTFIGGTSSSMAIGGAESTLEVDDQHVHQVRAGLRFNVN